jgi:hypothetical protein
VANSSGLVQTDGEGGKGRKKVGAKKQARALSGKQRKYLQQRIKGNSKTQAALLAGYSKSTALNATQKIETPALREHLMQLAHITIPEAKILARLAEGLDATGIKFATHEGEITDFVECVDFETRRKYLELAAEWAGYVAPRRSRRPAAMA